MASDSLPVLVDPTVSRRKLQREIDAWRRNEADYRARGWILLRHEDLVVEVSFARAVQLGGAQLPLLVPTVRFSFQNYDLWPPSLTFIDFFSGAATDCPLPNAWLATTEGPRNILLRNPDGKQFLCLEGTREFHTHPQHTGEHWALCRSRGMGSLAVLCERVWEAITQTVGGLGFTPVVVQKPPQQVLEITPQMIAALQQLAGGPGQA